MLRTAYLRLSGARSACRSRFSDPPQGGIWVPSVKRGLHQESRLSISAPKKRRRKPWRQAIGRNGPIPDHTQPPWHFVLELWTVYNNQPTNTMTLAITHDGTPDGTAQERCCMCRTPTRYWHRSDVALCQNCAKTTPLKALPTKAVWCAKERALTPKTFAHLAHCE